MTKMYNEMWNSYIIKEVTKPIEITTEDGTIMVTPSRITDS